MGGKHRAMGKWVTGPGGYKCACCGPSPRDRVKARRTERRIGKMKIRQMTEV